MNEESSLVLGDRINIPKASAFPKPEKKPSYKPSIKNFADNEETVAKVLAWAVDYWNDFSEQNQRQQFEKEMDIADEMYRVAKHRTEVNSDQSDNHVDTFSNVSSTSFYYNIRAITSGEKAVIFGNEQELPVVYEPFPGVPDYTEAEGLRNAQYQNLILKYYMDVSKMDLAAGKALFYLNKYGNQVVEMAWDYRKEKRYDRVPVFKDEPADESGIRHIDHYEIKEREYIIADWPVLIAHDMRNVLFDCKIPNMQDQSCVIVRFQKQLSDVASLQRTSEYMNCEKITKEQFYGGEGENDTLEKRQDNAGETSDADSPTNLVDLYHFRIRVPVNTETGKWEPENMLAEWYDFVIAGRPDGKPVCLQLSPNRHFCKLIPLELLTSHEDDKGALHLGFSTIYKCLYEMETTVFNSAFDNWKLRNRKPWILERGSINIRDKVFSKGGNQIWWKKAGAQDPHEIEVQDTTQSSLGFLQQIEDRGRQAMGTNKPFLGEDMPSRTAATTARITFEQAVKPALEDAKYKANQILPFIAFWCMEMSREFADPNRTITVTGQNEPKEVKPTDIWGPLNIRVVSIKNFQDSVIRRAEEDRLLQSTVPMAMNYKAMSVDGLRLLLSQVYKKRGIDNVDDIFGYKPNYDAIHVAQSENDSILFEGIYDMPKPDEDHATHLEIHKPFFAQYNTLADANPDNIRKMQIHIKAHEDMGQGKGTMQPPQPVEGATPQLEGEVEGRMMASEEGAMENMGGQGEVVQ
jgi:hypothetical protein